MYVRNHVVVPEFAWYFRIRMGWGTGKRPTNVPCCRNLRISLSSVRPLESVSNIPCNYKKMLEFSEYKFLNLAWWAVRSSLNLHKCLVLFNTNRGKTVDVNTEECVIITWPLVKRVAFPLSFPNVFCNSNIETVEVNITVTVLSYSHWLYIKCFNCF